MGKPEVILGIFGGMGPGATADLFLKVVALTPASGDQDHIPTLIYSLPQVPERTRSIREGDLSIIPWLVEGVTRLERAGASFIAIPCNTVHYYFEHMKNAVTIPIIHMIGETVNEVRRKYPATIRVGLLATAGTLESGLYQQELARHGLQPVLPDEAVGNEKVMTAVFGIKAGRDPAAARDLLAEAARHLEGKGADVIILACTEIPLVFDPAGVKAHVIDATRVLAGRAVETYLDLAGGIR